MLYIQGRSMNIHPSSHQLSIKLYPYLPLPATIAAVTYLASLSDSTYPGNSASLTAAAALLTAPSGSDHPLFAWIARNVASLPFSTLPIRMNLFSALCGTLCAVLLFSLVARLVFYFACKKKRGRAGRSVGRNLSPVSAIPSEVEVLNRKTLRIAVIAGLVASLLLTFSVAHWSASTRLDTGTFHLLLALASFQLLLSHKTTLRKSMRIPLLTLSAFIYTLGFFDFAAFVLLLPCFMYYLLIAIRRTSHRRRKALVSGLLLAGLFAASIAYSAYCLNRTPPYSDSLFHTLFTFATDLVAHHYQECRSFFPSSGWILLMAQTGLPSIFMLFWMPSLFMGRKPTTLLALFLLTLSTAPSFLILPCSIWFCSQSGDSLPVFGYTVTASAAAVAVAVCLKLLLIPAAPIHQKQNKRIESIVRLSMNANLPDVWAALFDVDIAMGNVGFIESDAKNQLAVDPDHALANYLLGSICLDRNTPQRSEDFLRRSINKQPTALACNNLGESLRQQKRLMEAETYARQALALKPDFPPALDTLACILLDAERANEAAPYAEKANAKCPNTPVYQLTLLNTRVKQKDFLGVWRLSNELKTSKTPIPETLQKAIREMRPPAAATGHSKG